MPPPRVRQFNGINIREDKTWAFLESLSYEATESSLHDLVERLDDIEGPRAEEVKAAIKKNYEAMVELENLMLDITSFFQAPNRINNYANEAPFDPYNYGGQYGNVPVERAQDAIHVDARVEGDPDPMDDVQEYAVEGPMDHFAA